MTRPVGGMAEAIARLAEDVAPDAVNVAVMGRVLSYSQATQTASVQVLLRAGYDVGDELVSVEVPPLEGVPVQWIAGAGASLHLGLSAGDSVLLVVRDRSHDELDDDGVPASGTVEPRSLRRFSLSDAVAIPFAGVDGLPASAVHASDPVLRLASGRLLRLGGAAASQALALAADCAARISRIEAYLNTMSLGVNGGQTAVPSPAPFTGSSGSVSVASVFNAGTGLWESIAVPGAGTVESDLASTRILTDG